MIKKDKQTSLQKDVRFEPAFLDVVHHADDTLQIRFSGTWRVGQSISSIDDLESQLSSEPDVKKIAFDTAALSRWDSSLLTLLMDIHQFCDRKKIRTEKSGLPKGVAHLLAIATAVPEKKDTGKGDFHTGFLIRVGESATAFFQMAVEMFAFIGDVIVTLGRFAVGKACFRASDLVLLMRETGAGALPIVSLISLLVGLILAFVGAVQLEMFGAQIYVANLVGIAMVLVMGAVMTGIIMAGRTGAAFAAQLGTMQVNEELDALETLGISPMEFLVLPRMLALCIMMPLLCLYADLMGVLGGLIVSAGMLDINIVQYYNQTQAAVGLNDFGIGLFHSAIFGVLVALSGCLRGIQCGRSASAVGQATTSAVVTGIVSIIVATAIMTMICNVLGI
jgi:phospholipid/cholesterol/gamma-HCH transport system permease protein